MGGWDGILFRVSGLGRMWAFWGGRECQQRSGFGYSLGFGIKIKGLESARASGVKVLQAEGPWYLCYNII